MASGAVLSGLVYCLVKFVSVPGAQGLGDFLFDKHETRLYGYSLTIIAYGTALLVAGFRMAHRDLRIAALAVVVRAFSRSFCWISGTWKACGGHVVHWPRLSLIGIAYLIAGWSLKARPSLKADVLAPISARSEITSRNDRANTSHLDHLDSEQ